jgi:hypothetical protein
MVLQSNEYLRAQEIAHANGFTRLRPFQLTNDDSFSTDRPVVVVAVNPQSSGYRFEIGVNDQTYLFDSSVLGFSFNFSPVFAEKIGTIIDCVLIGYWLE